MLKWYGHVMRIEELLCRNEGDGHKSKRKEECLREDGLDRVRDDIKKKALSVEEVYDRATCKILGPIGLRST